MLFIFNLRGFLNNIVVRLRGYCLLLLNKLSPYFFTIKVAYSLNNDVNCDQSPNILTCEVTEPTEDRVCDDVIDSKK